MFLNCRPFIIFILPRNPIRRKTQKCVVLPWRRASINFPQSSFLYYIHLFFFYLYICNTPLVSLSGTIVFNMYSKYRKYISWHLGLILKATFSTSLILVLKESWRGTTGRSSAHRLCCAFFIYKTQRMLLEWRSKAQIESQLTVNNRLSMCLNKEASLSPIFLSQRSLHFWFFRELWASI